MFEIARYRVSMQSSETVRRALDLHRDGRSISAIATELGVQRATVRTWVQQGDNALSPRRQLASGALCPDECPIRASLVGAYYAYLLGQYLGDGWINVNLPRGVQRLMVACCASYPGIVEECREAMAAVMPGRIVAVRPRASVINVSCYSRHWVCVFPQCGPGPKHKRPIVLQPWQEQIVLAAHPVSFVRGLIHSDGWRGNNSTIAPSGKRYTYTRYQFSNRSADIRQLFTLGCDALGVHSKQTSFCAVSVSRRASVAMLDRFVGAKY